MIIIVITQVCVYLASMALNIEHTIGGRNHDIFQNVYLIFMRADKWGPKKSKNC